MAEAGSSSSTGMLTGSAGSMPAQTPKSAARKKPSRPLNSKQLSKIVKNINSVQKSFSHLRNSSMGSLSFIGEGSRDPTLDEDGPHFGVGAGDGDNDEERKAKAFSYRIEEGGEADMSSVNDIISQLNINDALDDDDDDGGERWLRRRGLDDLKGKSKGPDGLALARVAAKGLRGKENARPESFLHEAGLVFNPLTRRVPHQTPRKQPSSRHATSTKHEEPVASSSRHAKHATSSRFAAKANGPDVTKASETRSVADPQQRSLDLHHEPLEIQEALLLEDLLHVLTGIEGQFIHYSPTYLPDELGSRLRGATFVVDEGVAPSLRDLVLRILPLATCYTAIFAFAEAESSLEFGTVVHAFCAAIRQLLNEYEVLIIQLEHQMAVSPAFTLQRLWFYVHPTLRTFTLLENFLRQIVEISHKNVLQSDDEGDDAESSEDDDDFDDDSIDQDRRRLLALGGADDDEEEVTNIVKGGELLSMLWDRLVGMGGDETASKLFSTLLSRASQPYSTILVRWITTGHLYDPYQEFLVMENPRLTHASLESDPTDEFWERRYTLRDESVLEQKEHERQQGFETEDQADEHSSRGVLTGGAKIPAFLEPWKRKILLAGKYLNVIRECGKDISAIKEEPNKPLLDDDESPVIVDITSKAFFTRIEGAYQRSNRALLTLLLDEYSIIERLRSMKHYFFLSHSDFFASFIEAADRELRKSVVADRIRDVTVMRLQSHLGMVLGSSSCVGYSDPFREDLRIKFASENAYDQLRRIAEIRGGIEAARAQAKLARQKEKERIPLLELMQFELAVKFPVSLVISRKNTLRWQFLQRPIIHLKSMEHHLCDIWSEHQEPAWRRFERGHPELERWKRRVFALRHRMLFFIQQMLAFIMEEVLEPNWRDLEVKMERATTVDEFLKDHFDFLNLCRKECMLTDVRFVDLLAKLISVIVVFCENRVRLRDQLHMERGSWQRDLLENEHQMQAPTLREDVATFLSKVEKHWEKRMTSLKQLVNSLSTTDNPAALPLNYRLTTA